MINHELWCDYNSSCRAVLLVVTIAIAVENQVDFGRLNSKYSHCCRRCLPNCFTPSRGQATKVSRLPLLKHCTRWRRRLQRSTQRRVSSRIDRSLQEAAGCAPSHLQPLKLLPYPRTPALELGSSLISTPRSTQCVITAQFKQNVLAVHGLIYIFD